MDVRDVHVCVKQRLIDTLYLLLFLREVAYILSMFSCRALSFQLFIVVVPTCLSDSEEEGLSLAV